MVACHRHEASDGNDTAMNVLGGWVLWEEHDTAASFAWFRRKRVNVNSRQRGEGGFACSGFALQI
jgi:hypothetical protein